MFRIVHRRKTYQNSLAWSMVGNTVKRQSAGEVTTLGSSGAVMGLAEALSRRAKNELNV